MKEEPTTMERRWANPRGRGILYVRDGWLWTSIGGKRSTTGLRWPEGNAQEQRRVLRKGMEILEARVSSPRTRSIEQEQRTECMTLYRAIADFKETKFPSFSRSIRSRYRMAIAHFLVNNQYGDMVLEFEALKRRIVLLRKQCSLDPTTRQKVQYKLQAFLAYCVDCGWIDRNPMKVIGIDKPSLGDNTDSSQLAIDSPDDVAAMIKWLQQEGYPRHADYVDLVYTMGLRPIEALKMRWEHYDGTTFKILGKKVRGNPSGIRYFPIVDEEGRDVVPGLTEKLNHLRRNADLFNGYVFQWRTL